MFGAYEGSRLVGFMGTFHVTFRYNDLLLKGVSGSFCTTHIDYKRKGIAKALLREATRLGIAEGYDIGCSVPDEGHPMEKALEDVCNELNICFYKPHRFTFLSKPLDKQKLMELADYPLYQKIGLQLLTKRSGVAERNIDELEPERDVTPICKLLNASYKANTLSVNWNENLLSSQLRSRISNAQYRNQNGSEGLINYFTIDLIGCREPHKRHKMTMIDNAHFEKMSFLERHRFVSDFCAIQKSSGCCAITIPTLPTFDLKPFYLNAFMPTGRYHCYFIQDLQNKLNGNVSAGYLFVR